MQYKMRYQRLSLLLVLVMVLLTACAGPRDAGSSAPEESQIFGASNLDAAPEPMAGITTAPASDAEPEPEPTPYIPPEPDEQALLCALLSEYEAGLSYDPADTLYFWRAVSLLAGHMGQADADGLVRFSAAELSAYTTALFGPDTEGHNTPGEENPWVTEEFADGESVYAVAAPDPFECSLIESGPEPGEDGSYAIRVQLCQGDRTLEVYIVTLEDFPADRQGSETFSRCVTGFSRG